VPLPRAGDRIAQRESSEAVMRIRGNLSLLQGYADIMDGLSPELRSQVMQVMAQKTRDLVLALCSFLAADADRSITEYGQMRERNKELLQDYRSGLNRLNSTMLQARHAANGQRLATGGKEPSKP
jgi:hypothetical protein